MAFSSIGKKKTAAHVFILLVNIIVLALASRVNEFQEYFYVADLFPLALSIITLVFLVIMLALDFANENSVVGYPQVEIGIFSVLSIFWLCFNAFSSSRWMQIPMNCSEIPNDYPDVQGWCHDLNGLKAMVWIEFLLILFTTIFTLKYSLSQSSMGNKHIWKGPLSRYSPNTTTTNAFAYDPDSSFAPHMSWQPTSNVNADPMAGVGYPFQGDGHYHHGNGNVAYDYSNNQYYNEKMQ